ncbi:MAG: nucleotide exchange factor GrpE [Desulfobacteraceae bacterium 4572_88]|nr:MAG: nucleotide exchange factor GrpE [Desulfobacteraceae bacterium 4572_88]
MNDKEKNRDSAESETSVADDIPSISKDAPSEKADDKDIPDAAEEMAEQLESAENAAKENHDRLLRVSAEFENYKKRSAREMESFRKFANEALVKDMLSVVDNLERAILSSADKEAENGILEGIEMTLREILKIFEKFSVTPIESLGERFDPSFHEAVMQEESEEHDENTVLKELQKGYMIHDRLLRPSMVIVSKAKAKKNKAEDGAD